MVLFCQQLSVFAYTSYKVRVEFEFRWYPPAWFGAGGTQRLVPRHEGGTGFSAHFLCAGGSRRSWAASIGWWKPDASGGPVISTLWLTGQETLVPQSLTHHERHRLDSRATALRQTGHESDTRCSQRPIWH